DAPCARGPGLEGRVELPEPGGERADRGDAAREAEPGAARLEDHLLRPGRAAVLLLRGVGVRRGAGPEPPPDALPAAGLRVLRLPPAVRLPGRSSLDRAVVRDLGAGVALPGDQLRAALRRLAVRAARDGGRAAAVPGPVLDHVLLGGLHRA